MKTRRMGVAAVVLMACTLLLTMRAYAQDYPVTTGTLTVSDSSPTAGDTITASGGGCAPGGTVTITIDGLGTVATATADASGDFNAAMVVPLTTGNSTVVVDATCGTASGGSQVLSATLNVQPLVTGALAARTNAPTAGGVITVSGGGCAPGEPVSIEADGTLLGSTTSDVNGDFITTVTVPPTLSGSVLMIASCDSGSGTQVLGVTLTVQAPASSTTTTTATTTNTGNNDGGQNLALTGRTIWATTAVASALGLAGIVLILIGRRTRND
ncbi:MAG: hypothetical protein HKN26_15690 [Acidimicrobiales bacterium]|nr:hypothetical protein [Acidimicrobiales bacterium]